jgi:hypothetical protein
MKQIRFKHEVVDVIPESLEANVLYVTNESDVAGHLCACGCGREVITPLSPTDWSITVERRGVTVTPSIGNWSFPCRSHYFIWGGAVVWARDMSEKAIAAGRSRDRARKQRYYARQERGEPPSSAPSSGAMQPSQVANHHSTWERLVNWWKRLRN